MKNLVRAAAAAIVVLSFVVPEAAEAQQPPARTRAAVKKAHKPTNEARWNSMLHSMGVLAHEGMEVKRITAPEKAQIDGTIAKLKQQIASAKQGGISEAEEDAIDGAIADEMVKISQFWSDEPRKKANPIQVPAKK